MPIERRCPRARTLGPFDQDDCPLANHVVEAQIACLIRMPQTVAVDVVDRRLADVIVMHQRVCRTGSARLRPEAAADGLDQCGFAGAQLSREPDDGRGAELGADLLTEPAELARGE